MTACGDASPPVVGGATYEGIADQVVASLASAGALPAPSAPAPWDAFLRLSHRVHGHFMVPATSFTPIMRRLVFALGFAAQPRVLVGIGTFFGYAFAWLLRDRGDGESGPHVEAAIGIDIDREANVVARRNCGCLGHGRRVVFVDGDGRTEAARIGSAIDLLYIDLDESETGKAGYRDVLAAALPHLAPGALILAHDACLPKFQADLFAFHRAVEDEPVLAGPWILPADECGLSVAVRRR